MYNEASETFLRIGIIHMSDAKPIVFVVDDDVSVRESLELSIRYDSASSSGSGQPAWAVFPRRRQRYSNPIRGHSYGWFAAAHQLWWWLVQPRLLSPRGTPEEKLLAEGKSSGRTRYEPGIIGGGKIGGT